MKFRFLKSPFDFFLVFSQINPSFCFFFSSVQHFSVFYFISLKTHLFGSLKFSVWGSRFKPKRFPVKHCTIFRIFGKNRLLVKRRAFCALSDAPTFVGWSCFVLHNTESLSFTLCKRCARCHNLQRVLLSLSIQLLFWFLFSHSDEYC